MGIHRTRVSGLEPLMGPPASRASAPGPRAPIIVGGRRILSPHERPETRLPGLLGGLSMDFSIISQHHWIIEVGAFKVVKASLLQRGIGP